MSIRKIIPVILVLAMAGAILAACMNDDTANVQPDPTANFYPNATMGAGDNRNGNGAMNDGNTGATNDGANGTANAGNTTALVGVKFDNAYKGELTERIREMVAAEVLKADPAIQTVAVTSAPEDVKKVYELSEQIRSGRTADELSADINSIVRNATTLR